MPQKKPAADERRQYRRLDTIFPVEFQLLDTELRPLSGWYQAFSQDISKHGICLTINSLPDEEFARLDTKQGRLLLQIHSPLSDKSFLAYSQVAWTKKAQEIPHKQYLVGLSFTQVDTAHIDRLIRYVLQKKLLWHILQLSIVGMIIFSGVVVAVSFRVQSRNLATFHEYKKLLARDLKITQRYHELLTEREQFNKELNKHDLDLEILKETIRKIEEDKGRQIAELEQKLAEARDIKIKTDADALHVEELRKDLDWLKKAKEEELKKHQQEVAALRQSEQGLKDSLAEITAKEMELKGEYANMKKGVSSLADTLKGQLYTWLSTHQNQRTGLVVSFEGDYDLQDISYTYDQALAIIAFTMSGDVARAKKGLDFFSQRAQQTGRGGFYNAYYAKKGDVVEYAVHAGPNLWLGIAAVNLAQKTKDAEAISLVRRIADWAATLQDKEGGLVGSENGDWYSTEHNLDGFAFFTLAYQLVGDMRYKNSADRILTWLKNYAYSTMSVPVNRGKGDATIATDTYAWSVTALGPQRLKSLGVDPDSVIAFAIDNCLVTDDFVDRFGKTVTIEGFDFAKRAHQARAQGGVVSCEWTAQMVLAFSIMSDYYLQDKDAKKATYYQGLVIKYLNELNKMVIASPSAFGQGQWCLPYASQENVDTGHGWRTPKGSRTGSVAATAYTLFAISNYNPLGPSSQ